MRIRSKTKRELTRASTLALLIVLASGSAFADEPDFGPNDVRTLFYISKSDGPNRVDYGMRLDRRCVPSEKESVFPYWHDFQGGHSVGTRSLGMFEDAAYGVAKQRLISKDSTGAEVEIALKAVKRPIRITTTRERGRCSSLVRTTIAKVRNAELISIYVKLSGPMSVDWILVKGLDRNTGRLLEERLRR